MARPRKLPLLLRIAPALALLASAGSAFGGLIRYDYGGVVAQADASTGVKVGDRFSGSLVYDDGINLTDVVKDASGSTKMAFYKSGTNRTDNPTADGTGLSFQIAGRTFAPVSTGLVGNFMAWNTKDGQVGSNLSLSGNLPTSGGEGTTPGVYINFESLGATGLGQGKLPAGLTLSALKSVTIGVESVAGGNVLAFPVKIVGTVDTLTSASIPEPAWTVAALLGAAFWAVRRRGREDV